MHVHQPDLATEIGAALGALEERLQPAPVAQRAVHQAGAIGTLQVALDQIQMMLGLLPGKHPADHAAIHWQEAVVDAGPRIGRVEQHLESLVFSDQAIASDYFVLHEVTLEVCMDALGDVL